ncbi:MAG: MFS transporter [Candidatus Nanoarchaeia archaeon]|nr:MFS transporter [Candidatus Nanoarchaeia archaeon]MDD5054477.1 MFS transporter [Candidatus Nanoarchaeia archaeon]MDD5499617.1 MFS transporter [Candidatus Nanoarchaeia archaeon]
MEHRKELLTIFSIMFTEHLGWSLILPFLPYYVKSFGVSSIYVGLIIATFSFFQFFSAPIIGKLSDKFGRKPLIIMSQLATATGFLILGFANSVFMIFLSRVIDGLLGSNMTLTNAYISDITKGKERLKIYGYSGIIFSLGMFIGPAIGGFLATIDYSIPAFLAFFISLITLALTIIFLKETVKVSKNVEIKSKDFFPVKDFVQGLKNPVLKSIFFEFFFFIFSFSMLTSSMALFSESQLKIGPDTIGLLFMFIGSVRIIFQALIFPRLANKFSQDSLTIAGLLMLITGLVNIYFVNSVAALFISFFFFSIGGALSRPSMLSSISNKAKDDERGKIMGVFDSLSSISMIIAPIIGAFIIDNYYPGTIGLIAAAFMIISLIFELLEIKKKKEEIKLIH